MRERRKMLTSKEAAKELKISRQTLSRYNLPKKIKIGNRDYYNEDDIEEILENGLENYLKKVADELKQQPSNSTIAEDLAELSAKMQEQVNSVFDDGNWERLMRLSFEFDALAELMELVYEGVQYTAVYETDGVDSDSTVFSEIDFFPCVDEADYEDQLSALAELANDSTNHITCYGIFPTAVFRALYREYLFCVFLDMVRLPESEKNEENKKQLLNFLLPFRAEYGKTVIEKKTE